MPARSHRLIAAVAALLVLVAVALAAAGGATGSSTSSTYIVLYKANAVPSDAVTSIQKAGGTLVQGYDQIGVAIASSSSDTFATSLSADKRVEGVSATA